MIASSGIQRIGAKLRVLYRGLNEQLAGEMYKTGRPPRSLLRHAAVLVTALRRALEHNDVEELSAWAEPARSYLRKNPTPSGEFESPFVLERSQVLRELQTRYSAEIARLSKLRATNRAEYELACEVVARTIVEQIV